VSAVWRGSFPRYNTLRWEVECELWVAEDTSKRPVAGSERSVSCTVPDWRARPRGVGSRVERDRWRGGWRRGRGPRRRGTRPAGGAGTPDGTRTRTRTRDGGARCTFDSGVSTNANEIETWSFFLANVPSRQESTVFPGTARCRRYSDVSSAVLAHAASCHSQQFCCTSLAFPLLFRFFFPREASQTLATRRVSVTHDHTHGPHARTRTTGRGRGDAQCEQGHTQRQHKARGRGGQHIRMPRIYARPFSVPSLSLGFLYTYLVCCCACL
jgi:hypothetical protein